jgi:hypothetical protein
LEKELSFLKAKHMLEMESDYHIMDYYTSFKVASFKARHIGFAAAS